MSSTVLVSAHHFLMYAQHVASELERHCAAALDAANAAATQELMPAL
jgi:hypothetical protein